MDRCFFFFGGEFFCQLMVNWRFGVVGWEFRGDSLSNMTPFIRESQRSKITGPQATNHQFIISWFCKRTHQQSNSLAISPSKLLCRGKWNNSILSGQTIAASHDLGPQKVAEDGKSREIYLGEFLYFGQNILPHLAQGKTTGASSPKFNQTKNIKAPMEWDNSINNPRNLQQGTPWTETLSI